MANTFVKAEQVAAQSLGLLERDTTLLNFVWRDPVGSFVGAKNDTVNVKVPAYVEAKQRDMRSATPLTMDDLVETSVAVQLDKHVYKGIRITDEEMTLDITNFGEQVSAPAMGSVVRRVDSNIGDEIANSSPEVTISMSSDPWDDLVDARTALNKHGVPFGQRFLAVGAEVENVLLKTDLLKRVDQSGSSDALREAVIGRVAGFTCVSAPTLDPDLAVAAHSTAYVASLVAPAVPAGAAWGATQSYRGLNMRVIRDYVPDDSSGPADRFLADTFMGTATVKDKGVIDADGFFVPSADGNDPAILVRAVLLQLTGS